MYGHLADDYYDIAFPEERPSEKATLKPLRQRWPRSLRKIVRSPAMN